MSRAWLPPALLVAYALAFGRFALGGGLLVFDDHPGQFYRLSHAITIGLAPWRLNPGWWAGYAELQYYPPGFAWLGAALHGAALGALTPATSYQALLWLAWLLPGLTTYALLRRALGDAWLALPGAFLALTLSAGSRSGVEEGLRWGLVAARLGWGLLPLLAAALLPWAGGRGRAPLGSALLVAAVVLLHPSHAPAAAAVLVAAAAAEPRRRRLGEAALLVTAGAGLAAVWLLPLLAHLDMALPLAWEDVSLAALGRRLARQPVLVVLAVANAIAWRRSGGPDPLPARWLLGVAPVLAVIVALDAIGAQPLGISWLPADRLMDSLYLGLILGASLVLVPIASRFSRLPKAGLALVAVGLCLSLAWGSGGPGLSLWPAAREWPKRDEVVRGARMNALWEVIRQAPPGRVLFLRSAVPLDYRPEWWRAHTHITALTPLETGRDILNGTFTHPSPVAGFLYTGSATGRPITLLAEQRDGVTLFGRPLGALAVEEFNHLGRRLAVSLVVALDQDIGRAPFLTDNPLFTMERRIGFFNIYRAREERRLPVPAGPGRWRWMLGTHPGGWAALPIAFSPLWVARTGDIPLRTRRDELGLLEVEAPAGAGLVEMEHRPGTMEWAGAGLSGLTALVLLALWTRRTRPALALPLPRGPDEAAATPRRRCG